MQLKAPTIRISKLYFDTSLFKLQNQVEINCTISPFIGNLKELPIFNNTLGISIEMELRFDGHGSVAILNGEAECIIESYGNKESDFSEIGNYLLQLLKASITPLQMSIPEAFLKGLSIDIDPIEIRKVLNQLVALGAYNFLQ